MSRHSVGGSLEACCLPVTIAYQRLTWNTFCYWEEHAITFEAGRLSSQTLGITPSRGDQSPDQQQKVLWVM